MGGSSKRHNEALSRLQKAWKALASKAPHFDDDTLEGVAKEMAKLQSGKLPPTVATLSGKVEEPGQKKFVLKFDELNGNCCNFSQIDQAKARGIIEKFKQITQATPNSLGQTRLIRDSVNNTGQYQSLFTNLSPDVNKLQEIEISGGGRIFSYMRENYFYIVSIETHHRDIDGH